MKMIPILQAVKEAYYFHIYHVLPLKNGYRLDTNCGPKLVTKWGNKEELNQAFLWREKWAKKGLVKVDRFIRTRSGLPYIQVHDMFLVVQDIVQGKPIPLEQSEPCLLYAQITGQLLTFFQDDEAEEKDKPGLLWKMKEKGERGATNKQLDQMAALKKQLAQPPHSPFGYLIRENWLSIEKRWRTAIKLFEAGRQQPALPRWLPDIRPSQWLLLDEGCFYFQMTEQTWEQGDRRMVQLLLELLQLADGSLKQVELFLHEVERVYPLPLAAYYTMLGELVCPDELWKLIDRYERGQIEENQSAHRWFQLVQEYGRHDPLQQWIARRIDRMREESLSL